MVSLNSFPGRISGSGLLGKIFWLRYGEAIFEKIKKTTYVRWNVKKRFEFRCLRAERSQELKIAERGIYEI